MSGHLLLGLADLFNPESAVFPGEQARVHVSFCENWEVAKNGSKRIYGVFAS